MIVEEILNFVFDHDLQANPGDIWILHVAMILTYFDKSSHYSNSKSICWIEIVETEKPLESYHYESSNAPSNLKKSWNQSMKYRSSLLSKLSGKFVKSKWKNTTKKNFAVEIFDREIKIILQKTPREKILITLAICVWHHHWR